MIEPSMRLQASFDPWNFGGVSLFFYKQFPGDGGVMRALPVTLEAMNPNVAYPTEPTIAMAREDAQQMMDELWRLGLRPSQSGDSQQGVVSAKDAHLKDLQKLVFERLLPNEKES